MAVTVSNIAARLAETLIIDTTADDTSETDIFTGTSLATKIYNVEVSNLLNGTASYVKIQTTSNAYAVASGPTFCQLYTPANTKVRYLFPHGYTFATGLSVVGSSLGSNDGSTSETSPSKSVSLKILGGT